MQTNTQQETKPKLDFTFYIVALVEFPDFMASLHASRMLARITSTALADNFKRWLGVLPVSRGAFLAFTANDRDLALKQVQNELAALDYTAVAHLGYMDGRGFHCVSGSADVFGDFAHDVITEFAHETTHQMEVYRRHMDASTRFVTERCK